VAFPIDTTGYSPEGYDLIVFGPGGPAIGLPLVIARFTVTASAAMPGLPNTGGGGLASGADRRGDLALGLLGLLVGLCGIGVRARRPGR